MAKLYVTEYVAVGRDHGGVIPLADTATWNENANSPLTITGVSTASVAFGANTELIRVHSDAVCSILISQTGTSAQAINARMAANQTEYFSVRPGWFISVITNT